ncbi:sulfatase [Microbulbifer agarilyticus]|uniref:sulfatase n=1 Tax=Microbulbifer agarilyticus TaxID=260552 RepID=UPI001CD302F0|nr:sulfatase [Microbulbifer agarilyticus]MCA0900807.1 sulfatase [Microbulbifer agarilyticus]
MLPSGDNRRRNSAGYPSRRFSRYYTATKAALLLSVLCFTASCSKATDTELPPPNIVVFLVDDLGLMDTSVPFLADAQGLAERHPLNARYHTPNLELLASSGTRFTDFYTQSVCSPTRSSLLTGQNAARHHTTTWIKPDENNAGEFGPRDWNWMGLDSSSVTFPKLLQQQGYKTIHIGKGHFGPNDSEGANPENIGFDVNIAGASWGRPKSYYGQDHYGNHPKYREQQSPVTHAIPHLEAYYDKDMFLTEALTREAQAQIRQAAEESAPFLLYMSHYAVHAPFHADTRFTERYKNLGLTEKETAFAGLVEGVDKSLGDIVETLEASGVADNTLVIFLGDNGTDAPIGHINDIAAAAPLRGKKGTSWEGGIRAPLVISWAKPNAEHPAQQLTPVLAGAINRSLTTVMDLYPTILGLSNTTSPEAHPIDGSNLKAQLAGIEADNTNKSFLMHFPHKHRHSYFTALRHGDWKLIYHYNPQGKNNTPKYQLFNLKEDPSESHNLAQLQPEKLREMVTRMGTQLENQGAQYPGNKQGRQLAPLYPR